MVVTGTKYTKIAVYAVIFVYLAMAMVVNVL
jgi:hypothetical protein